MDRRELLAQAVLSTKTLLGRYLAGFNDVTIVRQTPDLPNHVAWTLGHLAHTMHRCAGLLENAAKGTPDAPPPPLPPGAFVTGDGTKGSREKGVFDSEQVCFGSRPEERHDRFPTLARATEVYEQACDRMAATVRGIDDAVLDRPVKWGQTEVPAWSVVTRMVFHNGFHTGQIADLRRALGFKSIF